MLSGVLRRLLVACSTGQTRRRGVCVSVVHVHRSVGFSWSLPVNEEDVVGALHEDEVNYVDEFEDKGDDETDPEGLFFCGLRYEDECHALAFEEDQPVDRHAHGDEKEHVREAPEEVHGKFE